MAGGLIVIPGGAVNAGPIPLASVATGNPTPALPVSITIANPITAGLVALECNSPSFHEVFFTLVISPVGEHVKDPTPGNNSYTASKVTAFLTNSNPAITAMT